MIKHLLLPLCIAFAFPLFAQNPFLPLWDQAMAAPLQVHVEPGKLSVNWSVPVLRNDSYTSDHYIAPQ